MKQRQITSETQPQASQLPLFFLCRYLRVLLFGLTPGGVLAQSETGPYALSWKPDAILLGLGALTGVPTLISDNQAKVPTLAEVTSMNRSHQVNAFDRGATYQYSSQAGSVNDQASRSTHSSQNCNLPPIQVFF